MQQSRLSPSDLFPVWVGDTFWLQSSELRLFSPGFAGVHARLMTCYCGAVVVERPAVGVWSPSTSIISLKLMLEMTEILDPGKNCVVPRPRRTPKRVWGLRACARKMKGEAIPSAMQGRPRYKVPTRGVGMGVRAMMRLLSAMTDPVAPDLSPWDAVLPTGFEPVEPPPPPPAPRREPTPPPPPPPSPPPSSSTAAPGPPQPRCSYQYLGHDGSRWACIEGKGLFAHRQCRLLCYDLPAARQPHPACPLHQFYRTGKSLPDCALHDRQGVPLPDRPQSDNLFRFLGRPSWVPLPRAPVRAPRAAPPPVERRVVEQAPPISPLRTPPVCNCCLGVGTLLRGKCNDHGGWRGRIEGLTRCTACGRCSWFLFGAAREGGWQVGTGADVGLG